MGNHREAKISVFVALGRLVVRASTRFYKDEGGQSVIEYIFILSATVVGAGLMNRQILNVIDTGILSLGGQLEKDLKTGRIPLSVWQN